MSCAGLRPCKGLLHWHTPQQTLLCCTLALTSDSQHYCLVFVPVQDLFPFKAYFADAPGPLFKGDSLEEDMEAAKGCWRHLRTMFQELEECRAFELLKVHTHLGVASLLRLLLQ